MPAATLAFWIIKIAATTLGETGGDSVTMTLDWGYLAGTALFLGLLVILVISQMLARRFHPFLYWAMIVVSTTLHHHGGFSRPLAGDRLHWRFSAVVHVPRWRTRSLVLVRT